MPKNGWSVIKDMVRKNFATYHFSIGKRKTLDNPIEGDWLNTLEIYTMDDGVVCFQHLEKNDIMVAVFPKQNISTTKPLLIKRIAHKDYSTLIRMLEPVKNILHEATYDGGFTTEAVINKFRESKYKNWIC